MNDSDHEEYIPQLHYHVSYKKNILIVIRIIYIVITFANGKLIQISLLQTLVECIVMTGVVPKYPNM